MHEFSSLEAKNRLAIVLLRSVETEERVKILLARYARPIYDTQYLVRLIRSPSFKTVFEFFPSFSNYSFP